MVFPPICRSQASPTLPLLLLIALLAGACRSSPGQAPEDLVRLEKETSLRVAHARAEVGPKKEDRERLRRAQIAEAQGRQAIRAGDLDGARRAFAKANDELGAPAH